jgi:DNA mismatch repair protein MutL
VPDVIQLLSDHIANQIAAGEVIQRPASAVKELLENAIDAGATDIQLVIKDAGKELLQVIDNGKGMTPTDARMSFERHATSKIRDINDLFSIRTMGFRGEALASVAAVAQVEMKTRQHDNEVGSRLVIEATEVKTQEPCATAPGTNIMVKNLFYNVPARRHFLKSNTTEFRHIVDEFTRIALAHPQIAFKLWHNGAEQFHLEAGNLKTRIKGKEPGAGRRKDRYAEYIGLYRQAGSSYPYTWHAVLLYQQPFYPQCLPAPCTGTGI